MLFHHLEKERPEFFQPHSSSFEISLIQILTSWVAWHWTWFNYYFQILAIEARKGINISHLIKNISYFYNLSPKINMLEFCWSFVEPMPQRQGGKGVRKTIALLLKRQTTWKRNFWRCCTPRKSSSSTAAAPYPRSKTQLVRHLRDHHWSCLPTTWPKKKKKGHKRFLFLKWIIRMDFFVKEKAQIAWRIAAWNEPLQKELNSSTSLSI